MTTYQVVAECCHVPVVELGGVPAVKLLYKGAPVPDGVPDDRIKFLLDGKMIAAVEGEPIAPNASVEQDPRVGIPPLVEPDDKAKADDGLHPTLTEDQRQQQRETAEAEQRQADARAQLPADGSAPDGRKSDAVFVEYLVGRGYDRGEVEKASGSELRRLAKDAAKK